MNPLNHFYKLALGLILTGQIMVDAQVPVVKTVIKSSARSQETISINGINFGTNLGNIKVTFGGAIAVPQTVSDQLIEVNVPSGALFDNVGVTNISTGLSGNSKDPFMLSFGGINPFNLALMEGQFDFNSESGLYDLTVADFDGDGKSDVATSNDKSSNISVLRNTSTPGSISFSTTQLTPGVNSLHVSSGDLNGDGKPEILVTELNGARIFIFKNNSTVGNVSFASQTVTVTGAKIAQVRVSDLDLDGHPELIVTDQSSSRVFVVLNQSSLATIQFATPTGITLPGSSPIDGIAVGDLDGNQLPEIVVCEFLTTAGKIFILKNQSSPGALNFGSAIEIAASTSVLNLRIGDLDGDTKPDLAASALLASSVMIFGNKSTSSTIQFAAPVLIGCDQKPWGIDFADMDGDGKPDIAVASITEKKITILNNQSSVGNFSFLKQTKATTFINRHLRMGDIDTDGRPDLIFTSIDDNSGGVPIPASKISVLRNVNCVIPVLSPAGPITICSGLTQRITASDNLGGTYQWFRDGASVGVPSTTPFFDVTVTGSYVVILVNGSCTKSSSPVLVTVGPAAPLGAAIPAPVPLACVGSTVNLSVNDVGATDYVWTGPASFIAHGATVLRSNFQTNQAGKYTVEVIVGTCIAQRATVNVEVADIPAVDIQFSGSDIICEGQTKQLSIFPLFAGYTYQWADQTTGDISGAIGPTYTATMTGTYLVKVKSIASPACAAIPSGTKKLRIAKIPVVDFSLPVSACINQPVNFTDKSVVDIDPTDPLVNYVWDFGDTGSSAVQNPNHTFSSAQNFNIKLTVSYRNFSCPASKIIGLPVQTLPVAVISNPSNRFTFCPKDSVLLEVVGSFTSYKWNTGAVTPSIYARKAGGFSVDVTTGSCKVTATKTVSELTSPSVVATAEPASIQAGDKSQLNATSLTTFLWRPNKKNLTDSLIANPIASPIETTTYTVSGKDTNGCKGEATIEVIVILADPLTALRPAQYFSPNGDDINPTWLIENAPNLPTCSVAIYDERGLKVFEAKPYLNNWDGISAQGKVLPAGVYYYVLKCEDSAEKYLAGSVNIVR